MSQANTTASKYPTRVFSGVQPSGAQVHIGNYLGAMKRFVTLAEKLPTMVCIVDLHALTSVESRENLIEYSKSLTAAYLAISLDPAATIIFRQSDVPEVCELSWYLACQFPLGLLERAHAFKDSKANQRNVNSGLMFYPVLMAADILLYRSTLIPVGADQKQHVEMTRDVAASFNHRFGDIFPMPEPLIEESTGVIPGLDGRKMSKRYNNYIGLFEPSKEIKSKVMKIVTDSKSVADVKDPDTCNVFNLYKHFGTAAEQSELRARYTAGGMGYGDAKKALFEAIEREVQPMRERYNDYISRPDFLHDVLKSAAGRAREIAGQVMADVRAGIGVGPKL